MSNDQQEHRSPVLIDHVSTPTDGIRVSSLPAWVDTDEKFLAYRLALTESELAATVILEIMPTEQVEP